VTASGSIHSLFVHENGQLYTLGALCFLSALFEAAPLPSPPVGRLTHVLDVPVHFVPAG